MYTSEVVPLTGGPYELEAKAPSKPYAKAELSEEARKRIAELSADHVGELQDTEITELPARQQLVKQLQMGNRSLHHA